MIANLRSWWSERYSLYLLVLPLDVQQITKRCLAKDFLPLIAIVALLVPIMHSVTL